MKRAALTLVELIVVLLIVAALITLLIPVLQRLREASNRLNCANHLKQLALAVKAHHAQHDFLPTAGSDTASPPTFVDGLPAVGNRQNAGWGYQILPYLEGGEKPWKGGDAGEDNGRARVPVGALLKVFFCPSRRQPTTFQYADGYLSRGPDDLVKHALCDFAANNLDDDTGAIRANRFGAPLRLTDIVDGTSTTLLVSEKRMNHEFFGVFRLDDSVGYTAGNDWNTMRNANLPPAADVHMEGSEKGFREFGSAHQDGLNVAFVDGSLRYIMFNITPSVFVRLGARGDGAK